ncbi:uncharacterized protein (DUF427 family) [Bradyrhizobium algeriense]|uniref:Uncharacterized protein (DUF427 family) n=1 Tax=Bradyrhizobium algeriense TaxID=634784 RepID=A0ABU8B5E3_9BRAD
MGLSWQQGPLSTGAVGRFLVPEPLPKRLLYVERLRRRMRVRFGGTWVADSENVLLLFEPARYPVAYFPEADIAPGVLERAEQITQHADLGPTSWYSVRAGAEHVAARGAWQHTDLPAYAIDLQGRIAFAWRAMDAFYEEDERIVGHAADPYHRIDIRQASRSLVVRHGDRVVADTKRPLVLYESGFAPRWYVPRENIDEAALAPVKLQTFCPYKGLCSYFSIGDARQAAWSYPDPYLEVRRIANLVSFEPDVVTVHLGGVQLHLEPGQSVVPHGPDRNLDVEEFARA